jgi:peptidyl-prolyl cis-trans isomerase D
MPNAPKQKVVTRKHLARLEREKRQRRFILLGTALVLLIVIGSIIYGILDANIFQYNQAVAKVGSQVITVRDFQDAVRFQRYQMIQQYNQYLQFYQQFQGDPFGIGSQLDSMAANITDTNTTASDVVNTLVENIVIANECAKRGIVVTDAEVNDTLQSVFGYYPNGTPTPTTTPTEILTPTMNSTELAIVTLTSTPTITPTGTATATETPTATQTTEAATSTPTSGPSATPEPPTETPTITPTPTPYTLQGYQTQVAGYVDNLKPINVDEAWLRSYIRAMLLRQKLTEAIGNEVPTSQDEVWARQIVVADQNTANTVETRLKNGENFGALASELSTDTATKSKGGDLGWITKGTLDSTLETAVWALKVGEISQPIQTSAGWYIVQVIGHEVRPLTADQLTTARSKAFSDWLTAQTSAPDVKIYQNVWSAKIPVDPSFTPIVIPTQALSTSPAVVPTTETTPQPSPQETPQAPQPTSAPTATQ